MEDPSGHVQCAAVADIQLLMPAEYIVYYQMQEH